MPREDRATWKSNYFMKIIVSAAGAAGRSGAGPRPAGAVRCEPGPSAARP